MTKNLPEVDQVGVINKFLSLAGKASGCERERENSIKKSQIRMYVADLHLLERVRRLVYKQVVELLKMRVVERVLMIVVVEIFHSLLIEKVLEVVSWLNHSEDSTMSGLWRIKIRLFVDCSYFQTFLERFLSNQGEK